MNENLILSFGIYLVLVTVIVIVFAMTRYIAPKNTKDELKNLTYESGIKNFYGGINSSINVKYYLVAIVFVLFDIEAIFMYPWAVNLRNLNLFGLIEMFVFMAVLLLGLAYIYKKRVLRWE